MTITELFSPELRAMQNEHFWPKHWQRVIKKIERVECANDYVMKYYVLPRNGGEFMEFRTAVEIDEWARVVDRLDRSNQ